MVWSVYGDENLRWSCNLATVLVSFRADFCSGVAGAVVWRRNRTAAKMKCVLGILASLSLISCPSAEFSKAPAYNKRFGFNISHSGLLSNVDYAVQQDGPNWHIRLRSGELRYDPDTIHLTPEEIVELEDDDEHYRTTRTIRDGDQIVAAGGLALASHSFRQALQDPNFYQETIKSRNLKTLYPVFEKHGTKTDQIQGYVQMTFISPNSIPLQLHPGTEEAREAERQLRVQEESQRQLFLIQQRKEKMEAVRKQEENYNYFEITIEKKKKTELLFDPKAFPLKLTKRVQYLKEGDELVGQQFGLLRIIEPCLTVFLQTVWLQSRSVAMGYLSWKEM